jgi:nucleoside-diphosphate-sugar epimerase
LNTLLIIGGTGFFGNSILSYFSKSKSLKKKFNKIIVISRNKLATFRYTKNLKKNYSIIKKNCDILKLKKLPKADYVIYAAILKNYRDDYLAVKNYAKLVKIYHSNSKILYTSSGAVYGIQPYNIKGFKEDYLKYHKKINFKKGYKQSYANFKLKSEKLFQKLGNEGFNVSIARCFAFVGEYLPLNSNFVIGNIIQSILEKKDIKINANYRIYRSYMYTDDLVQWLLKILDNSNTRCPIYNVGSNDKISIHRVINTLAKKYNKRIDSIKLSPKKFDSYLPNINKAKKILGLKISNTSVEGIIKTLNILSKKYHYET